MKPIQPSKPEAPKYNTEQIEEAIVQVGTAAKALLNSRLNMAAIVALIDDSIPAKYRVSRDAIRLVLNGAADLERNYLRARR